MASFLDKQGVWVAWDYGSGPAEVIYVSEDPVAIFVAIAREGMYFPGFWPERMTVPEAVEWWKEHASEYIPQDRTKSLQDAEELFKTAVKSWSQIKQPSALGPDEAEPDDIS